MAPLRARTHFAIGRRHIRPGDIIDSTDPIVAGREQLFSPVEDSVQRVEQATARPGEGRNVRPPAPAADGAGDGPVERPDEKKGKASDWRAYAASLGIEVDVDGKAKTKKQLIAEVDALDAAAADQEPAGDGEPPADDSTES